VIDYQVTVTNEGLEIRGDFPNNLVPIAMPDEYIPKKRFASFFLHKNDVEKGMIYLRCISIDKHIAINEALFIAGLNAFIKCFKSDIRVQVSDDIFSTSEQKDAYAYFNSIRNKHFFHDENGMIQTTDFILVDFDTEIPDIYNASVVWNSATLDFQTEANALLNLMIMLHNHICSEIDKMADSIVDDFKEKTKEELLRFNSPEIKLASTIDVGKKSEL